MSAKGKLKFIGTTTRSSDDTSQITIFPEYREALEGLTAFSHIIILYWLHLNDTEEKRSILKITPKRHKGAPEVGVFASRSPVRPNPIGLSICELLEIKNGTLTVRDFDAVEGTRIIDIKPYIPRADSIPDARAPSWTLEGPKT